MRIESIFLYLGLVPKLTYLREEHGSAATAQGEEESIFWVRSPHLTLVQFLTHRGSPVMATTWPKGHGVVIWQDKVTGEWLKPLNSAFSELLCHRHFWGSGKWFLSLYASVSSFWDDGHDSKTGLQTFSVSLFYQDIWETSLSYASGQHERGDSFFLSSQGWAEETDFSFLSSVKRATPAESSVRDNMLFHELLY